MSADTIRLHEVEPGQGLADDGLDRLRAQRLNVFPGRALGEDEFDRIQAWGDARIAALEGALPAPGIIGGLQCRLELQNGEQVVRVAPGVGLGRPWWPPEAPGTGTGTGTGEDAPADTGRGRELHSLNHSLTRDWIGLRDAYKSDPLTPNGPLNGLYLVLLQARFFHLDVSSNQAPCRRDEPDRLRDARIARGLMLGLVGVDPALWQITEVEQHPLTAANRFLGGLVTEPSRMPDFDGVAVALIGVRNDALLWLDAPAGAFPAVDKSVHLQLRAHLHRAFQRVLADGFRAGDTPLEAMQGFSPAYLPAAAELPPFLLASPAGVNPLPRLDWFPTDAALDLQVLPESSLPVIMGANLNRPATRFDALAGDRYRIGLVLTDREYRDGLLELPTIDPELPDLLRRQGILARNAAADLQASWDGLAAGFDEAANPDVKVPPRPQATEDPEQVLIGLGARGWRAKAAGATLDAPYSARWPAPADDLPEAKPVRNEPSDDVADGLLARAAAEQAEQERLEEMLADIDALLALFEEEKKHGRGLVDTLTVDLAQLAGGIAGDGSGLRIASIARQVDMSQKQSEGE